MKKAVLGIAIFLFSVVQAVMAEEMFKFDRDKVYVGGGLSDNSLSGSGSTTGFQVFAGYHFDYLLADGVAGTALEVGFMDAGSFDVGSGTTNIGSSSPSGIWITGLALLPMNSTIDLVGRLGLDLGDDDGVIFGFGLSYQLTPDYQLKGEYVLRDHIDSLQINISTDVKSFM